MNDEVRESTHIRMKRSVVHRAHQKAKEEGKTLGLWLEEAINEKVAREEKKLK